MTVPCESARTITWERKHVMPTPREPIIICETNRYSTSLTWTRVAHSAYTLDGNATCTSVLLIALEDYVTLARGTVVALLEDKRLDGRAT